MIILKNIQTRFTRLDIFLEFLSEPMEEKDQSIISSETITLTINGTKHQLKVEVWTTLLDLLREKLQLTGTKKGCDQGQCGACTILLNGKRINSCLSLAVMHDGAEITTIEGIASNEVLHPVQQAFIDHDAFQCGYCTPGQICSAIGLISEGKANSLDDIRDLMSGNVCRCGAYSNIVKVVREALENSRI